MMKPIARLSLLGIFFLAAILLNGCLFKGVKRTKGIMYLPADATHGKAEQKLNVFAPRGKAKNRDVLVFFYGGNWTSGKRSLYSFLGNRLARKGVVAVIVDYPKSPDARYDEMALDAATSVKWVQNNIDQYGGDPQKIFVAGHSAGGHLAALITTDHQFFQKLEIQNPIKGAILIDAAGLDMYGYMKQGDYGPKNSYLHVFTREPENWKAASPLFHIRKDLPPMLIFRGGRTYPSIITSNEKFVAALKKDGLQPEYIVQPRKKHIPMITQFFNVYNPRYKDMLRFMKAKDH